MFDALKAHLNMHIFYSSLMRGLRGMYYPIRTVLPPRLVRTLYNKPENRIVQTLVPENMQDKRQKIIDLSGRTAPVVYLNAVRPVDKVSTKTSRLRAEVVGMYRQAVRFPANTTGMFYFHEEPDMPKLAGAIRFRLCDSVDAFSQGHDLERSFAQPWAVNLYSIAKYPAHRPWRHFLVQEGLVSEDLFQDLEKLPLINTRNIRWLFSLDQTFVFELQRTQINFVVMTRRSLEATHISTPFGEMNMPMEGNSLRGNKVFPFKGYIRLRLEQYNHPKKGRGLVLRVVENMTPIECEPSRTLIPPTPGQLVSRINRCGIIEPYFTQMPYGVIFRHIPWHSPANI
ncbi:hypothetical protein CPB84DRAFT_1411003 [Gymnopilus junonius]|uniref:Uncharacterized protein n=1 Tax=Gymnopilus junonius TaxID=109634 RepID=A0A9P5NJA9_GYMJU|nr:hypothetical protein CPB84DRAFT_1411003 [Gymnopilus junonius]